jgi:predicted DNA-binding antitoxin AbrB/MazE fold protein
MAKDSAFISTLKDGDFPLRLSQSFKLKKKHNYNRMPVKVRYENNVLKPLEKLDLNEIIKSNADRIVGLLKDIDIDSVDLQHAARDIWVRKVVSD